MSHPQGRRTHHPRVEASSRCEDGEALCFCSKEPLSIHGGLEGSVFLFGRLIFGRVVVLTVPLIAGLVHTSGVGACGVLAAPLHQWESTLRGRWRACQVAAPPPRGTSVRSIQTLRGATPTPLIARPGTARSRNRDAEICILHGSLAWVFATECPPMALEDNRPPGLALGDNRPRLQSLRASFHLRTRSVPLPDTSVPSWC